LKGADNIDFKDGKMQSAFFWLRMETSGGRLLKMGCITFGDLPEQLETIIFPQTALLVLLVP
jgi:hypothetical protein